MYDLFQSIIWSVFVFDRTELSKNHYSLSTLKYEDNHHYLSVGITFDIHEVLNKRIFI